MLKKCYVINGVINGSKQKGGRIFTTCQWHYSELLSFSEAGSTMQCPQKSISDYSWSIQCPFDVKFKNRQHKTEQVKNTQLK